MFFVFFLFFFQLGLRFFRKCSCRLIITWCWLWSSRPYPQRGITSAPMLSRRYLVLYSVYRQPSNPEVHCFHPKIKKHVWIVHPGKEPKTSRGQRWHQITTPGDIYCYIFIPMSSLFIYQYNTNIIPRRVIHRLVEFWNVSTAFASLKYCCHSWQ